MSLEDKLIELTARTMACAVLTMISYLVAGLTGSTTLQAGVLSLGMGILTYVDGSLLLA